MDQSKLIICKASAGAGKTFTLVKEYLKLAFDADDSPSDPDHKKLKDRFRHILAITFTNKATNEMKERILKDLSEIIHKKDCGMRDQLVKETHWDEAEVRRRAAIVKKAILHNYSELEVCTIDSFMRRVVKSFAHELNIPANFETVIEQDALSEEAADQLMTLVGKEGEEELTRLVYAFADSKMESGSNIDLTKEFTQIAKKIFQEDTKEHLDRISNTTPGQFLDAVDKLKAERKNILDGWKTGYKAMCDNGVGPQDLWNKTGGAFVKLAEGTTLDNTANLEKFLNDPDKTSSAAAKNRSADIAAIKPTLIECYNNYKTSLKNYRTINAILKNIYTLAVLDRLGKIVKESNMENDMVHISEFNKAINEIVRQCADAPFIYERIGSQYWNYLIDEFQDTSRMQWQNLVPLLENGVGSGHTSLVVGDAKQAIYRFRQGDVDQFIRLPEVQDHDGKAHTIPGHEEYILDTNYRSRKVIVDFNNSLFKEAVEGTLKENEILKDIYIGKGLPNHPELPELHQNARKNHSGGYIELKTCDKADQERMLEMVKEAVVRQHELGYEYSDIMILARWNDTLSLVADHLNRASEGELPIPVKSEESFLIKNSLVVKVLVSLLAYLSDPKDRTSALRVAQGLELLEIAHPGTSQAFADSKDLVLESVLRESGIELDCSKMKDLTIYDVLEEAIRTFRLQVRDVAFTATLLDMAASYSKNHHQDLTQFLEWLDDKLEKTSVRTSGKINAVQMLTIHKAKGLSAPIVICIVEPRKKTKESKTQIWQDLDKEEYGVATCLATKSDMKESIFQEAMNQEEMMSDMDNFNTFYVALTRPEEKLHICALNNSDLTPILTNYAENHMEGDAENGWHLGEDLSKKEMKALDPKEEKEEEKKEEPRLVTLDRLPSSKSRIRISQQYQSATETAQNESLRKGLMLHAILEKIRHKDDTEQTLAEYFAAHELSEEEKSLGRDRHTQSDGAGRLPQILRSRL